MKNKPTLLRLIFAALLTLFIIDSSQRVFSDQVAKPEYEALYSAGKYADALSALETAKSNLSEFTYSYNKGVVHHALGQEALAVAYLERARALQPNDPSIDEPLETSRVALAKIIGSHRLDPASYFFEQWGEWLPLDLFFVLGGAALGLLILVFVVTNRKFSRNWSLSFLAGLTWVFIFGLWSFWMDQHPAYVVISDAVIKSGPQSGVLEKGMVYTGTKVRRTSSDEREGFIRVRFSGDGDEGFVELKSLLLLSAESNKQEK